LAFEITLDRLTNYISTFGGAYSQLGQEQWMKTANMPTASSSSLQALKLQRFAKGALGMAACLMRIAQLKQDENLATRCNLFAAQACLQLGSHRAARRLLKACYPICQRLSMGPVQKLYSSVRAKYMQYALHPQIAG
jgi:hypothetical protein